MGIEHNRVGNYVQVAVRLLTLGPSGLARITVSQLGTLICNGILRRTGVNV